MNNVFFSHHDDLKPTGGACAGRLDASLAAELLECKHDQARFTRLVEKGEPVILVHLPLVGRLTGSELAAVIAHEQGHIANGHLLAREEAAATGCTFDMLKQEFEADEYSASVCGAQAMYSALDKILSNLMMEVAELAGDNEQITNRITRQVKKNVIPRLDRLKAMM